MSIEKKNAPTGANLGAALTDDEAVERIAREGGDQ